MQYIPFFDNQLSQILAALSNGGPAQAGNLSTGNRSIQGGSSSNGDYTSPQHLGIPTPQSGSNYPSNLGGAGVGSGSAAQNSFVHLPPMSAVEAFSPRTGEFLSRMVNQGNGNGNQVTSPIGMGQDDNQFGIQHRNGSQPMMNQSFDIDTNLSNLPRLSELNAPSNFGMTEQDGLNGFLPQQSANRPNGRNRHHSNMSQERTANGLRRSTSPARRSPPKYPKLPGFKPPPHRFAQYGLVVPSTAASSEDESEDTLPRSHLNAPIEALQALANAADSVAQENAVLGASTGQPGFLSPPRVLQNQLKLGKRKHAEPTPRNAFPDVMTKGLVQESEARELWDM